MSSAIKSILMLIFIAILEALSGSEGERAFVLGCIGACVITAYVVSARRELGFALLSVMVVVGIGLVVIVLARANNLQLRPQSIFYGNQTLDALLLSTVVFAGGVLIGAAAVNARREAWRLSGRFANLSLRPSGFYLLLAISAGLAIVTKRGETIIEGGSYDDAEFSSLTGGGGFIDGLSLVPLFFAFISLFRQFDRVRIFWFSVAAFIVLVWKGLLLGSRVEILGFFLACGGVYFAAFRANAYRMGLGIVAVVALLAISIAIGEIRAGDASKVVEQRWTGEPLEDFMILFATWVDVVYSAGVVLNYSHEIIGSTPFLFLFKHVFFSILPSALWPEEFVGLAAEIQDYASTGGGVFIGVFGSGVAPAEGLVAGVIFGACFKIVSTIRLFDYPNCMSYILAIPVLRGCLYNPSAFGKYVLFALALYFAFAFFLPGMLSSRPSDAGRREVSLLRLNSEAQGPGGQH